MVQSFQPAVNVSRDEVKRGIETGEIVLIDVREAHEFSAGHIPGSMVMPLSAFDPDALSAIDKRIVFSCAAGVRSMHALKAAQQAGFSLNEHYAGGFRDWITSGEAVETGL